MIAGAHTALNVRAWIQATQADRLANWRTLQELAGIL